MERISIHLAVKPFGEKPPYQKPGKGMEIVSTTIDGERVQTERDMADALLQEADLFNQISADDVIRLLRETVDNL